MNDITTLPSCPFCNSKPKNLMGYEYHKVGCSNEHCPIFHAVFTTAQWIKRYEPSFSAPCPNCGEALSKLRSTNEKKCTSCGTTVSWVLKQGERSTLGNHLPDPDRVGRI